mmetsp:Transcript_24062/g.42855  ORF Transcript_24062/g.42855 Transcript_24062/m.42855 type:complete len:288 (+) Transcript_24062:293-1156(+)
MPLKSAFSTETPRTEMTGIVQNISFGFDFSIVASLPFQRAPCMLIPMMYAPSRVGASTSSAVSHLRTSVNVQSLSSSHMFFCAATCEMAVRKDCGLTRPEIHVTLGSSIGLPIQSSSCVRREAKLFSHRLSGMSDGHARFAQAGGMRSRKRQSCSVSIESDMVSSPAKPKVSSLSERTISVTSTFITSISCMNTFWYGPWSSSERARSSTSNFFSAKRSIISLSACSATACGEMPPSSDAPDERGCSSMSMWNIFSLAVVRKSISAFGWRPYAIGVSCVSATSMCVR